MWRANAHTWVLNKSPNGLTGGESSACQVKYPSKRSVLLPVPRGSARYAAERSKSVIMRTRAITLPRRVASGLARTAWAYPSTAAVMSIVSIWMPSVSTTRLACSRLSMLDDAYGMRTPMTFSFPSARAAKYAVSEESTPPDNATMPFSKPRRTTTSSRRKAISHRSSSSASIARGSVPSAAETSGKLEASAPPSVTRAMPAS